VTIASLRRAADAAGIYNAEKAKSLKLVDGILQRDELIAEGHATAARLVREAEAQQRSDMNRLEQEKAVIEHSIQQLRSFEREYRTRLKSYIESQLIELDSAGVAPSQQAPGSTPGISG
jgi:ClpP class serine protease